MRYLRLAFLLLGFLAFISIAAPLASPDLDIHDVKKVNEEKTSSKAIVYMRDLSEQSLQTASYIVRSVCTSDDEDCDKDNYSEQLEKRGRAGKTRPSRKTPARKKAPKEKTPTTKKPSTGNRDSTGTGGRVGGKKTPIQAQPGKSKSYLVVEAAAKKKGKKLVVGKSYLLTEMSSALVSHHKLIVAKVVRKGRGKKKQLDIEATMQQLILKKGERRTCFEYFGGVCEDSPLKEYNCAQRVESGKATFKFSGTAKPEFADPEHFILQGHHLLIKNTRYNIFTNNCQYFAVNLANVARQTEK